MFEKGIRFFTTNKPNLSDEYATTHFCFIGATGSGKTVCIRLLMQSVLFNAEENTVLNRAVVYDAKGDALPVLHGIVGTDNYEKGANHKVVTLNPFDTRSYSWDISADIKTLGHALQMASILIPPDEKASQPFFANASRDILFCVLTIFIKAKVKWTLRDVMCVMMDAKRIKSVLESDKNDNLVRRRVDLYFSHPETSQNIMSEIASRLGAFEIIAALWDKAEKDGRTISLEDWLKGTQKRILVLGSDPTNRFALNAINQVIFKRISELILAQPDDTNRRTWFFLDEFVRAGKLEGMVDLATVGRSKGACIVLGFQDINGARAVYSREIAEEIIGQCTNIAVLRLQSPETAEWASRLFGQREKPENREGTSIHFGQNIGQGKDKRKEIVKREAILPSQFMYLPMPSEGKGLHGFRYSPYLNGITSKPLDHEKLFGILQDGKQEGGVLWKEFEIAEGVKEKGLDYRKPEDQYLDDWEKADYERLNLMETYREDEIEKRQKEKREDKEKLVRELAELSFLQGFPSISQLKKLNEISSQEQKAFFRVLDELKKNRLFLGENPTNEILNAVNACEIEEKRLFNKIVDFLNGEPKKTEKKPTDASNDPVGALLEKSIQEAGDELK